MKKDNLEDFVRSHHEEFDQLEPSEQIWENILKTEKKRRSYPIYPEFFKIAAVISIGMVITAVVVRFALFNHGSNQTAQKADPELNELIEAETYYAHQVDGKMNEIRKCYALYPEIKNEIENDLIELESMYNNLRNDLKENLSNKIVIEAMIENSRNRLKLVDDVLDQIEC